MANLKDGVSVEDFYPSKPKEAPESRLLIPNDFKVSRIPLLHTKSRLDKIQHATSRQIISRYIENIQEMLTKPAGMYITGEPGVGKSAAAALIAMEAIRKYKSVLWVTHENLININKNQFKETVDGLSINIIKNADLVVLDNISDKYLNDKWFDLQALETLLSARIDDKKPTIITTLLKVDGMKDNLQYKRFRSLIKRSMIVISLLGKDLGELINEEFMSFLNKNENK
jgi:hypothetical protein